MQLKTAVKVVEKGNIWIARLPGSVASIFSGSGFVPSSRPEAAKGQLARPPAVIDCAVHVTIYEITYEIIQGLSFHSFN